MDKSSEALYKLVYKNAQMGMGSTSTVLSAYKGNLLCDDLSYQSAEYAKIFADTKKALGGNEKGCGLTVKEKFMTSSMIKMKLMSDRKNASKAAEMIIQGSNMGIIDAIKGLHNYPDAADGAKRLANDLIHLQTNASESMKQFL